VRRTGGFTLVEVMITVAIIGILAALLIVTFNDAPKKTRSKSEVQAMFTALHNAEAEYMLERGSYYSTGSDEGDIHPASPTTSAQDVYPVPAEWEELKVDPAREQLYCGYVVVAGKGTDPIPGFASDFGMEQPTVSWYALYAECNQDGNASLNAVFFSSSTDVSMQFTNETK
jgi:prepilin-type N-terminal cleavage/methylation domain-containing protein